jgi:hypothetical protein
MPEQEPDESVDDNERAVPSHQADDDASFEGQAEPGAHAGTESQPARADHDEDEDDGDDDLGDLGDGHDEGDDHDEDDGDVGAGVDQSKQPDDALPSWPLSNLTQISTAELITRVVNFALVAGSAIFIFAMLHPELMLRNTTATGGDMGAHVWQPAYIRDNVLEHFRLSWWTPDYYAGMPAGQYYFPVPTMFQLFLDIFLPYNIAFKIGTVAGIALLPISAYVLGRGLGAKRPVPAAMAIAMLPFLFDRGWTIYGSNIYSAMAGMYSNAWSLAFALFFLGTYAAALRTGKHLVLCGVLFALAVMSHVMPTYVVLVPGAVVITIAHLIRRRRDSDRPSNNRFTRRFVIAFERWRVVIVVAGLGAALCALWVVPFITTKKWLTDMGWEALPEGSRSVWSYLMPANNPGASSYSEAWVLFLAAIGVLIGVALGRRSTLIAATMWIFTGVVFAVATDFRIWNARILPFWFLWAYLLAATCIGEFCRVLPKVYVALVALVERIPFLRIVLPVSAVASGATSVLIGFSFYDRERQCAAGPTLSRIVRLFAPNLAEPGAVDVCKGEVLKDPKFMPPLNDVFQGVAGVLIVGGTILAVLGMMLLFRGLQNEFRKGQLVSWSTLVVLPLALLVVFAFVWLDGFARVALMAVLLAGLMGLRDVGGVSALTDQDGFDTSERSAAMGGPQRGNGRALPTVGLAMFAITILTIVGLPLSKEGVLFGDVSRTQAADIDGAQKNYSWFPFKTDDTSGVRGWARWNFSGYEDLGEGQPEGRKQPKAWLEYDAVNAAMVDLGTTNGCGRVLWDYEGEYNRFGTTLALMLLPYWTQGCMSSMEGIYFEASSTTPYHFLNSAVVGQTPSNPMRDMAYGQYDLAEGVKRMQIMGIKYYMTLDPKIQADAAANPDLTLVKTVGPFPTSKAKDGSDRTWHVYEVADIEMVSALKYEPVVLSGVADPDSDVDWLRVTLPWYQTPSARDVFIASSGPKGWQRFIPIDDYRKSGECQRLEDLKFKAKRKGVSYDVYVADYATQVSGITPDQRQRCEDAVRRNDPEQIKQFETIERRALPEVNVTNVVQGKDYVTFSVDKIGSPVVVKTSFFPNWRVEGATGPYRAGPNQMIVIPTSNDVRVYYAWTRTEILSYLATATGILIAIWLVVRRRYLNKTQALVTGTWTDPDEDIDVSEYLSEPRLGAERTTDGAI